MLLAYVSTAWPRWGACGVLALGPPGDLRPVLADLRGGADVDIVTLGQYLRPTAGIARRVDRYVPPRASALPGHAARALRVPDASTVRLVPGSSSTRPKPPRGASRRWVATGLPARPLPGRGAARWPSLSGVLLALSFPKFGHWAVAWVALAPLLVALPSAGAAAAPSGSATSRRGRRPLGSSTGRPWWSSSSAVWPAGGASR